MREPKAMSTDPITIRRTQLKDAAALTRIMEEPAVRRNLMQLPYASEELWTQRLTEGLAPGKTELFIVAERKGVVVGSAGLHPATQLRRRHAAMLGISVAVAHHGTGVGQALMQALCDYADHWGQLLRIELTVFSDNARAIALYRRFGFEQEGLLRAYALRDGVFADCLTMARLHPQPPSIR
jgi:L-phenylalanine/L-methionine N-acetyltransferase